MDSEIKKIVNWLLNFNIKKVDIVAMCGSRGGIGGPSP